MRERTGLTKPRLCVRSWKHVSISNFKCFQLVIRTGMIFMCGSILLSARTSALLSTRSSQRTNMVPLDTIIRSSGFVEVVGPRWAGQGRGTKWWVRKLLWWWMQLVSLTPGKFWRGSTYPMEVNIEESTIFISVLPQHLFHVQHLHTSE